LGPRFYGPFEIEDRIGTVAYRLRLPAGSVIHLVIHISQLKKHLARGTTISPTLPIVSFEGQLKIFREYVLARRAIKRNNMVVPQLLVKWSNLTEDDASWEDYTVLKERYPDALLEDKKFFEDRGVSDEEMTMISATKVSNKERERAREEKEIQSDEGVGQRKFKLRAPSADGTHNLNSNEGQRLKDSAHPIV
jgi:Chromo (CHRromatin Organisation MOdifier) domain